MRVQDAASYRPVPVSADRSGRMDEPTTAVRKRLPAGGESRAPGATGPPAPSPHQRSASAPGGEGEATVSRNPQGSRRDRHAGYAPELAPEADCREVRWDGTARARSTSPAAAIESLVVRMANATIVDQ